MHKHCKHMWLPSERVVPTFRGRGGRGRSGQALVEFAFILFIVVFLFGGALSLGYFFYSAQSLQTAVDVGAHEIARMPFPPDAELGLGDLAASRDTVMWGEGSFREDIYHEKHLIVPRSELRVNDFGERESLSDFAHREMPLLNRLLVSVMIPDPAYDPDGTGEGVFRYPGAIVRNINPDPDIGGHDTVLIPVMAYDELGQETLVRWIAPVEEIVVDIGNGNPVGQFSVVPPPEAPDNFLPGVVALRINFPAQAATIVQRRDRSLGIGMGPPISGDDWDVEEEAELPSNYELVIEPNDGLLDGTPRIHAGRYGLGRQAAYYLDLGVRPYRRIISVEAIYRREVFGAGSENP